MRIVNVGSGLILLLGCLLALINTTQLCINKIFQLEQPLKFIGGFASGQNAAPKSSTTEGSLSGIAGKITIGRIRLQLGSIIMISLTLLVAADVIDTIVKPADEYTLEGLYKLAIIAGIRTGLSYFLGQELKEVEEDLEAFYQTKIIV